MGRRLAGFGVADERSLLFVASDDRKFKGSRRKQAPRRDEIPEERTLRKNGSRELPGRDDALRAALREEVNAVNEKTEARRVARVALSEIKTLLAEDDPGEETAWRLKMKTLEVTRETLKLEKERIGLERERMEVETRRMEVEREKMEWEKERRAREKAEKESVEREEAERQKADEGRLALDEATEERERLEKLEGERSAGEEGKERERLAGDGEHAAEGREKEAAEKERLVPESDRPAQGEEKERAPRLSRDEAARNRTQAERPDARKANATQAPEEKSRRAGGVTAGRREKVAVADKMAAGGKKK
ncbi:uncharacterized abhydrolase domain-containing protein DDB_G0269086-like isoform X2 [Phyllopteryx taeniolatus]|uniref:uncharacterized abhydrolase domain-containing protein DDB_G0269086-like isoform X2 n=1 Tax=Phyllopteryx taeniolatus TaxID=161469 RepID=UPI002AD59513|nr:uncharacterized abhydrolase domain-containing protein DDB_G0269086-like isoform X2 [Phyllopteryx taeniolatus]